MFASNLKGLEATGRLKRINGRYRRSRRAKTDPDRGRKMLAVLIFAITLLVAVLLSGLARRSVLSTAVLFLASGFILGGALGWVVLRPDEPVVARFAELAIFSVLFTEGMRVSVGDLTSAWRLPGRALLFGLPLTLIATASLAQWVAGLPWGDSLLLGAILSPTDPVFAAAIVGREEAPGRLRHLLNVECGLNDGLALPIVIALIAWLSLQQFHLVTRQS
jgi:NhaP-type Na+/H+ or K+/H+ antiporter